MTGRRQGRRHADVLTPAEWRVLEELRAGSATDEIAARTGISSDAVENHISTMLGKLDLPDRYALLGWRPEQDRRSWLGTMSAATKLPIQGTPMLNAIIRNASEYAAEHARSAPNADVEPTIQQWARIQGGVVTAEMGRPR